jgi:nucleotide-binding universal stress UspA family protein
MLKRILVGLNGSHPSRAAVELAIDWARRHESALIGLTVVDIPRITAPEPVPMGASAFKAERDAAVVHDAQARADELLSDFAARCASAGIPSEVRKFEGNPAELLMREAQRADLLLVGRKSLPSETAETTKVLEQVLRFAARPVVCVPDTPPVNNRELVLVAYDGSVQAARAIQAFQSVGLANRRQIHLLTVAQHHANRYAAEVAADYLRSHGHDVALHVEPTQVPAAKVILSEAERLHAGLIVMGSYGQPVLKELFFGSVTKTVLRDSKVPLLLYH